MILFYNREWRMKREGVGCKHLSLSTKVHCIRHFENNYGVTDKLHTLTDKKNVTICDNPIYNYNYTFCEE